MADDDSSNQSGGADKEEDQSTNQSLSWSSKNHEVVYEQGNDVLNAQKEDINEIDDKALRTVRITALVIGVGATGLQAITDIQVNEQTAMLGGFLLFLSLTFGVITYTESSEIVGPTAQYLDNMRGGRNGTDWEVDYLVQIPGWISRNQEKVERNALLFSFCQFLLITGVGFGAASLLQVGTVPTVILLLVVAVVVLLFYWLARYTKSREHPNS